VKSRVYYFSSTGNSLRAAGRIAGAIGAGEPRSVVAAATEGIDPGAEVIGIVFPVYLHKAPAIVLDFLASSAVREDAYVFAVATNNGECGSCMAGVDAALRKGGGGLAAGFGLLMPGNSVIIVDLTNPPEERARRVAEAEAGMDAIAKAVLSGERNCFGRREAAGSFVKSRIYGALSSAYRVPRHFRASAECNRCGLCARSCPRGNVAVGEAGPAWGGDCANCLACYHACPRRAIDLDGYTKGWLRYRHPEVRLEELLYR
jgi:ferredoxin